jgi:PAS domain S-box-containing protein
MRRLIAPPVFADDEEKTQAAQVLNAALLTMLVACLLYSLVAPIATTIDLGRLGLAGLLVLWLLGMLLLMHRGHLRLASSITIAGMWLILTLLAVADGQVRSLTFGGYMILVLSAGLLLGLRPAFGVAVTSAAAGLALLYAMHAGALPAPTAERPDILIWLVQSIYLLVAAALLARAIYTIERALGRARRELGERKQAEDALRASEGRYRTLVEKMGEGLIQVDNDDVIQFVNDRYCEMTGYLRTELVGKKAAEVMLISEEDRHIVREKGRLRKQGYAVRYEIRLRKKSGEVIWVEVSGALVVDAAGQVIGSIGVNTDITARKQAEAALRESDERHRVISELVSDYAFAYRLEPDATVVLEWVTDAMTRITGYALSEMTLDFWQSVTHPDDLPIALRRRQRLHTGQPDVSEYRILAKDGRILWLRYYSRPVWDAAQGRVVRVYGAVQDITRLKQLEQQLGQAQKMEAVGQLAGGVAHDINNILTIILSNCDLILDELSLAHQLRDDIGQIQSAATRAAELTQQLLAFSRQQVLQPRILNLNDVVATMEKLLRPLIGEHIQLLTRLQPDLGLVYADPGRIEQVVMNLAINARDAMPDGGTLIVETANVALDQDYAREHVDVRAGPYVMLAISDTGSGMDAATHARIFEPFFTTKAQGKGTGLGLATVHGIVNQSGGHIWVYSEPGHGSTFKVYLPQAAETAEAARAAHASAVLPYGSATILLVEDEQAVRELASRILRRQGYRILEAADGQAALRIAGDHMGEIDLLLTDVVMPGGFSGRQLAEQLVSQRHDLKVLYMSGYTDDAITHYGVLDAGIAYLQKPFTPNALVHKVQEVLEA